MSSATTLPDRSTGQDAGVGLIDCDIHPNLKTGTACIPTCRNAGGSI